MSAGGIRPAPGLPCPASAICTSWLRSVAQASACRSSFCSRSGLPFESEAVETFIPMWWKENPGSDTGVSPSTLPIPS